MSSPHTMSPLVDTLTASSSTLSTPHLEPSALTLTTAVDADKPQSTSSSPTPPFSRPVPLTGKAPTRAELDLEASVKRLEEAQRRRGEGKSTWSGTGGDHVGGMNKDAGMMPPPPLPVTIHAPTPPRMSRMPSLSQISTHLHLPSPIPNPNSGLSANSTSTAQPITPTKSRSPTSPGPRPIADLAAPLSSTSTSIGTHGFIQSPSGRLRLPPSAMTRSRSGSGSSPPPLKGLGMTGMGMGMSRSGSAQGSYEYAGSGVDNHTAGSGSGAGAGGTSLAESSTPTLPARGSTSLPTRAVSPNPSSSTNTMGERNDLPSLANLRKKLSVSSLRSNGSVDSNGSSRGNMAIAMVAEGSVPAPLKQDAPLSTAIATSTSGSGAVTGDGAGKHKQEYRLKHQWTMYYDAKSYKPDIHQSAAKDGGTGLGEYEKSLLHVGSIDTVQSFAQYMNNLRLPSRLPKSANYHLFKTPIRPMWEDPANASGGKWVVLFRNCPLLMDWAWANLTMGLIGEILDEKDEVTGIVASSRPKVDRIQVWLRGREDIEGCNELGKRIWGGMGLEGEVGDVSMEFQYNDSNTHPPAGAFIQRSHILLPSITNPAKSSLLSPRPHTPHTPHMTSPLQQSTRHDNSLTPSPTLSAMGSFGLPATSKMGMGSTLGMGGSSGSGTGIGMKRLGSSSGQGAMAFAGPMGGLGIRGGGAALSRDPLRNGPARVGTRD